MCLLPEMYREYRDYNVDKNILEVSEVIQTAVGYWSTMKERSRRTLGREIPVLRLTPQSNFKDRMELRRQSTPSV